MSIDPGGDLASFHDFVGRQLQQGLAASPEEVLDLWRGSYPAEDIAQDAAAVHAALHDFKAGDQGVPLGDFHRDFLQRRGIA